MIFKLDTIFYSPCYVAFAAGGEALFAILTDGVKPDANVPRFSEIGIMLPSNETVN